MAFNAEKFLHSTVSAPMSTVVLVCPEGEYKAFIDDGDKAITFRDGDKAKNLSPQAVVLFSILDEEVRKQLKREKVLVPMNCWLDLDEAGEDLDLSEGKNVSLGRLRKAVDQNEGAWNPMMLKGKGPLMVKVTNRSDKNDPIVKYAEVSRVSRIT